MFKRLWVVVAPYYNIAVPKVIWSTFQIVCTVPVSLYIYFPSPLKEMMDVAWISQVDATEMLGIPCTFAEYNGFIQRSYISYVLILYVLYFSPLP